jgi:hypothetical protein
MKRKLRELTQRVRERRGMKIVGVFICKEKGGLGGKKKGDGWFG